MSQQPALARAAEAVALADTLLIGAGAGMGVDSGLPDFRGDRGFWKAYPALRGYAFADMANPSWFDRDPHRAWGFYGHRLNLYRATVPHEGFAILRRWAEPRDTFVFTSNVDGQFQKAGFADAQVCECHGSIHHLQRQYPRLEQRIWSAEGATVTVDERRVRAADPLPRDDDGALLRPNILMFGDMHWLSGRTDEQHDRMRAWGQRLPGRRLVAVEIGAGTAIPSVRDLCERTVRAGGAASATLIRINPREAHGPAGTISLAMGGADALRAIDARLSSVSSPR